MKIPTGLLRANARVAAQLAELDLDDALVIVLHQIETMGLADLDGWRLFLDRRRKRTGTGPEQDRNERGARPEQDRNRTGTGPEDFRSNSARPEFGGPQGGSGSSLNSDPDLSASLSGSSPKLSSPEGGPDTDGHAGWGLSDQPRTVELPVVIPVAPPPAPPRAYNPAAVVEAFAHGVGGFWFCPSGKQFSDLARALQPHLAKSKAPVLEHARSLGARWAGFCGGAPENGWKAGEWLAKGAPGPTSGQGGGKPGLTPAQERAEEARRATESKAREAEWRSIRERAVVAPPDVQAEISRLFDPPPSSGTARSAQEQAESLRKIGGGDR